METKNDYINYCEFDAYRKQVINKLQSAGNKVGKLQAESHFYSKKVKELKYENDILKNKLNSNKVINIEEELKDNLDDLMEDIIQKTYTDHLKYLEENN